MLVKIDMFNHNDAQLETIKLHYVSAGQGDLILFVHGFPEFWYAWKNQLETFSADHLAVALDLRGYNLSDKPQQVADYAISAIVDDLRGIAGYLGRERFTLVAHDWGGLAAWVLAMLYPHLLNKLVIINSPHPLILQREIRNNPAQQKAIQYINAFQNPDVETILAAHQYGQLSRSMPFGSEHLTEVDLALYREAWAQPGALTGGLNYYRATKILPNQSNGIDWPDLPHTPLSVPTLVIWGEQDSALLTGNLNGLEELVSNLTVKRIPDGTHWVIHEQPARVNALIREFLSAGGD